LFVRDFLYDLVCDGVTSVNQVQNTNVSTFNVFPNPNDGNFFIEFDSDDMFSVMVFDNLGRRFYFNPEIQQGLNSLELNLPPGMYTVQAYSKSSHQLLSRKIIVH
jgi:hypothetical protein